MRRMTAISLLVSSSFVLVLLLFSESHLAPKYRAILPSLSARFAAVPVDGPPPLPADDLGDCQARNAIFFMKTHKCASSTVQNILLRYGERHMLDFVLPDSGNYIGSPALFNSRSIPSDLRPRSGRFHIFAHHTRLHVAETRRVMRPDAAWVTILRDPVAQFESAYDYYRFDLTNSWNMSLHKFIALPLEEKKSLERVNGRFGGNQMTFDLGYDPAIASEPRLVDTMLAELDQAFHLVMIAEMMDESLVLLRNLMCWSTDDVAYLVKNARFNSFRAKLSDSERAALEEFLALDVILYRYFVRRLAQRIAELPVGEFVTRSETLVARRLFWRQQCVTSVEKGGQLSGQQHEITDRVQGYRLSDTSGWMCSRLGMAEIGYTNLVRDAQRQRLAVWRRVYRLLGIEEPATTVKAR